MFSKSISHFCQSLPVFHSTVSLKCSHTLQLLWFLYLTGVGGCIDWTEQQFISHLFCLPISTDCSRMESGKEPPINVRVGVRPLYHVPSITVCLWVALSMDWLNHNFLNCSAIVGALWESSQNLEAWIRGFDWLHSVDKLVFLIWPFSLSEHFHTRDEYWK